MENVSVGWATRIGIILTALAGLMPLIGELADAAAPLGVPPDLWVKVSAAIGIATIVGRMLQAFAKIISGSSGS